MKDDKFRQFDDFKVGDLAFFSKKFDSSSFKDFKELSGDSNPLHCDSSYAGTTEFGEIVVPVHMVAAPLSRIAGMIFPGKPSLYLSQDLKAIKPVYFGEQLTYSSKITSINSILRTLTIKVLVIRGLDVVIKAKIVVKAINDSWDEENTDNHSTITKRSCLITGATGAIGSAFALKIAAEGFDLVLQCRKDTKKRAVLEERLSKIISKEQKINFITADLLASDEVVNLCDAVIDYGGVDYVVHFASPPLRSSVEDLVKVNYSALEAITNAAIPGMLFRQKGAVVSIGSVATEKYIAGWQHYSAAKAMANQYLSSIDRNYSEFGVRGLTVLLGLVSTDFSNSENISAVGMLPEEAADALVNVIVVQHSGQSVIIDLAKELHGTVGFNAIPNVVEPTSALKHHIETSTIIANPEKIDADLSFEVEELVRNSLNLVDVDIFNGGLGITPGWDSLRHIEIILELENQYKCKFSSQDIEKLTTVSDIVQIISKLSTS